jgi:hypothetical protein
LAGVERVPALRLFRAFVLAGGALSLGTAGGSWAEVAAQDAPASLGGRSGPPPLGRRPAAPVPQPPPPKPTPPKPTPSAEADDRKAVGQGVPASEQAAPAEGPAEETSRPPATRPSAAPERAALITDPTRLIGLGPDAIRALFGKPDLIRHEPPAEIWQYARRDCVLDLFLYPDPQSLAVIYLEARTDDGESTEPRRCVGELLADEPVPSLN